MSDSQEKNRAAQETPLPLWEKVIFCAGDLFGGGGQSVISVLYLIFLTNVIGINPAWAGTVLMLSKLWDAISDPLMGVISDNTRSPMGRRRPYILAGGALLFAAIALMWYPVGFASQMAKVVYMTVVYIFYSTASTIISVPYCSMSTEITTDIAMRSKLNLLRLVFSQVSTAICTLVPTVLFESLSQGKISVWSFYFTLVFGFGTAFALPLILIGLFTKERAPYNPTRSHFSFSAFVKPFYVRAFRRLLLLYLCQAITLDIVSAVIMYYSLYVVAGLGTTVFLGIFMGVQLLMFPVINHYVDKVSKPLIYRLGLPLSIVCAAVVAFYPAGRSVIPLYVLTAFMALGFAGAQTMCWIIFPDVVDIGTLGLEEQITGSFSGVMTFIRKASSAIALFVIGYVLELTGFITPADAVPTQPASAVLGIRLIIFLSFFILMGTGWFAARQPRLYAGYMQDPARQLWYHSYWVKAQAPYPGRGIFWGRGNGWVMTALPMLLDLIGPDNEEAGQIKLLLRQTADALLPCQLEDGSFPTVLGKRSYAEQSATALIAAGLLHGVRCSYLPQQPYRAAGEKAFQAVLRHLVTKPNGEVYLTDISAPTIPLQIFPCTCYRLTPKGKNWSYGVAAAVFAALEYDRLQHMVP